MNDRLTSPVSGTLAGPRVGLCVGLRVGLCVGLCASLAGLGLVACAPVETSEPTGSELSDSTEDRPTLTVALSPDIPPYVLEGASSGLEVEILRRALPDHELFFVQMPYAELQTAVPDGLAQVSAGVQQFDDDGAYFSRDFVTFVNAAIAKTSADLRIDSVSDLAGHPVFTWEDADRELGPEFERLFSTDGSSRDDYREFADQEEQVRAFWDADDAVAVIDRAIFESISRRLGHDLGDVVAHELFPPVTDFRVAFESEDLRDAFDRGLEALCASGDYDDLLARYEVEVPRSVCEGAS